MTESKTREFWIWGFKIAPDESISQNCLVSMDKGGSAFYDPVHHVIEFSAYQAEREKVNELVDALKTILSIHKNDLGLSVGPIDELIKKHGG